MHLCGFVKAVLPYVVRIELGPIEVLGNDECRRTLVIVASGCTLKFTLNGPIRAALEVKEPKA